MKKTLRYLAAILFITSQLVLVTPTHAEVDATQQVHYVQRGETLSIIASHYSVSLWTIAKANNITNINFIWAGQRLTIPGSSPSNPKPAPVPSTSKAYYVKSGDTLANISRRFAVSLWTLASVNYIRNVNFIYVGQRLTIPGQGSSVTPQPQTGNSGKWIEVDLSEQRLYAHEGDRVVLNVLVSTGLTQYPTPVGRFSIRLKIRSQTMSGPGYYLPGVEWAMYFYRDYAIHGTYWHNNFGHPMSHGCVNMTNADARFLFNWASVGTQVVVHW